MKKIITLCSLILFVSLLPLAGCATLPTRDQMALDVKGYTLPQNTETGNAMVYVVRPSSLGTLIRFNVFVDNEEDSSEMGYTRGWQYIYFFVTPGEHTIYSKAENWAEITIDAKAGDIIFLKQDPEMGFIIARNILELIPDVEGKYCVKHSSLGTVIRVQK